GLALSPFGLAALAMGQTWSSLSATLFATALCGFAAALAYRGGLGVINALAPAERRAEMASCYFVGCFLGNALPILGVGLLSASLGQTAASWVLAAALGSLAAGAAALIVVQNGPEAVTAP